MEVAENRVELERIVEEALLVSEGHSIILDHFLKDAVELDVDVLSDGQNCVIAGLMSQVEEAGVHSGDSCSVLPARGVSEIALGKAREYARKLCSALRIIGLANIQMMAKGDDVTVLEVNPRASRTVPFVSKATGFQVAKIAACLQAGAFTLEQLNLPQELQPRRHCVKSPVFPFHKFPGIDPRLGAEMKSTGEAMGIARSFEEAFLKAELAAGNRFGTSAAACHCGRWRKTIVEKLSEAGVRVFTPASSAEAIALLKGGKISFIACGMEGGEKGAEERKLAAALGVPCISSAFKAIAVAQALSKARDENKNLEDIETIELGELGAGGLEQII